MYLSTRQSETYKTTYHTLSSVPHLFDQHFRLASHSLKQPHAVEVLTQPGLMRDEAWLSDSSLAAGQSLPILERFRQTHLNLSDHTKS